MDGNLGRLELDELEQEPPGTRQERVQDDMPGLSIQTSNDNVQYQVRYGVQQQRETHRERARHHTHSIAVTHCTLQPPTISLHSFCSSYATSISVQCTLYRQQFYTMNYGLSPWLASSRFLPCLPFPALGTEHLALRHWMPCLMLDFLSEQPAPEPGTNPSHGPSAPEPDTRTGKRQTGGTSPDY